MSIKLELYRVFQEVADRGSVSAAAKSLYVSQSAVSQAVKQLEEQLGVRLFTRGTRGVTLTGEGSALYEYVRSALSLIQNGEEKIAQAKNLLMGELVIGASDTITSFFLLPHLDRFHSLYPQIRLKVLNGTSPEVVGLLKSGKVDVAFANLPVEEEGLSIRRCFGIQDVFVAARDYDLDFDAVYTPQEVARMPLILLEKKSCSRGYVERYFVQNAVTMVPEIELGSHDLLLALTRIGLGVSCVIREFSREQLESGEVREVRVRPPISPRWVGACLLKNVSPSAACAKFLEGMGLP